MIVKNNSKKSKLMTLCICTMNRPKDLSNCLSSVFQSSELPDEVIVSDDSLDGKPTLAVTSQYRSVIYQEGPHRGLGPNRNACIQRAKGTHIIFIDDDVCVPPNFFTIARKIITATEPKTIITGYEIKYTNGCGEKITPHNADFWGLQRVPVVSEYRAIVINATIFPCTLFQQARFDENLRYGSEEIDMAQHAVALGYQIQYKDNLYVNHYSSPTNRGHYQQFIHASRLYATTKAYWQYEHAPAKTIAYLLLAPLQLIGSALRRGDIQAMGAACQATVLAGQYLFSNLRGSNPNSVQC
jgi:glycosyltransferase involved in cell wall biosynthesis